MRVSKSTLDEETTKFVTDEDNRSCLGVKELPIGAEVVYQSNSLIIDAVSGYTARGHESVSIILVNQPPSVVFGVREEIPYPQDAGLGISPRVQANLAEAVHEDKTLFASCQQKTSNRECGARTYSTQKEDEADGESST